MSRLRAENIEQIGKLIEAQLSQVWAAEAARMDRQRLIAAQARIDTLADNLGALEEMEGHDAPLSDFLRAADDRLR